MTVSNSVCFYVWQHDSQFKVILINLMLGCGAVSWFIYCLKQWMKSVRSFAFTCVTCHSQAIRCNMTLAYPLKLQQLKLFWKGFPQGLHVCL